MLSSRARLDSFAAGKKAILALQAYRTDGFSQDFRCTFGVGKRWGTTVVSS